MKKGSLMFPGLLFIMISLSIVSLTNAQTTFEKTYGGPFLDGGNDVIQTSDGGFILVGNAHHSLNSNSDVFLIRTNEFGDTLWTRRYSQSSQTQFGLSVIETSDHYFVITGYQGDIYSHSEVLLIKTDSNGSQQWFYTYNISGYDYGLDVKETSDGGFIIAGQQLTTAMLIKTDSAGNMIWEKDGYADKMGGGGLYGGELAITSDGGFAFTAFDLLELTPQFFKTNASGNTQIHKTYTNYPYVQTLTNDPAGGFVLAGGGSLGFNVMKIDVVGSLVWQNYYSDGDGKTPYSVTVNQNDEIVICGKGSDSASSKSDFALLNISSTGTENWRNYFGESNNNEVARAVISCNDGGYALAGNKSIALSQDIYFVKTNEAGKVISGIEEVHTPNPTELVPYPNPCLETISFELKDQPFNIIQLIDLAGRIVYTLKCNLPVNKYTLNVGELAEGFYLVKALLEHEVVGVCEIVRQ